MFTVITTNGRIQRRTKVKSWLEVAKLTFMVFDCDWDVIQSHRNKNRHVAYYDRSSGKISCNQKLDEAYNQLK